MKKENIWVLPNILTVFRIVITPVFFGLLLASKTIAGLVIFLIAALTDGIDGFIARYIKQKTKFGEFLDPMADKFMVILAVVALMINYGFPLYGLLILLRDIVSLSGSYLIHKKKKDNWKAANLGKATTFMQIVAIIMFIIDINLKFWALWVTIILSIITAGLYSMRIYKLVKSSR